MLWFLVACLPTLPPPPTPRGTLDLCLSTVDTSSSTSLGSPGEASLLAIDAPYELGEDDDVLVRCEVVPDRTLVFDLGPDSDGLRVGWTRTDANGVIDTPTPMFVEGERYWVNLREGFRGRGGSVAIFDAEASWDDVIDHVDPLLFVEGGAEIPDEYLEPQGEPFGLKGCPVVNGTVPGAMWSEQVEGPEPGTAQILDAAVLHWIHPDFPNARHSCAGDFGWVDRITWRL